MSDPLEPAPASDLPKRPASEVDWPAVVDRFSDLVHSVPRRMGLSSHDADEVYQNTWMAVFANERVPVDEGMAPWLATVAQWQVRAFRSRRRSRQVDDEAAADVADAGARLPEDLLAQIEEDQALRDALAALSERDRLILEALYLSPEPLSYKDVARMLRVSVGSIGAFRQRALDRLRDELKRRRAA